MSIRDIPKARGAEGSRAKPREAEGSRGKPREAEGSRGKPREAEGGDIAPILKPRRLYKRRKYKILMFSGPKQRNIYYSALFGSISDRLFTNRRILPETNCIDCL